MCTEINLLIDSFCYLKQSKVWKKRADNSFLFSYSSYSLFCSFAIIQARQLLGKLIKDLDNEGNSSILWIALCCAIFWSQNFSCQLLLPFGWLQLHVYVAKLFSKDMSMLVRTLFTFPSEALFASAEFIQICISELHKSHVEKSDSVTIIFLI